MAEGASIEVAHHLTEHGHGHGDDHGGGGGDAPRGRRNEHHRSHRVLEVIEVFLLAVVAIATAWSGFQAAKWDGEQSRLYGVATAGRFQAEELDSLATSELIADGSLLTAWLQAHDAGDEELEQLLEKRMTPEYKIAFDAWLETDPFDDASAPKSPAKMPEYRNPFREKAKHVNAEAQDAFSDGTDSRQHGEDYIRNTVLLAMVLFLAAIAQRFKDPLLRGVLNGIALVVMVAALLSLLNLPRA